MMTTQTMTVTGPPKSLKVVAVPLSPGQTSHYATASPRPPAMPAYHPGGMAYHPLTEEDYTKMFDDYQTRRRRNVAALADIAQKRVLVVTKQHELNAEMSTLADKQQELDEQQQHLNHERDHLAIYRRTMRGRNLVQRASSTSAMLTAAKRKRDEYKPASFDDEPRSDLRKLLEAAREAHITEMETNMRNLQAHKDNIMTAIAEVYTK